VELLNAPTTVATTTAARMMETRFVLLARDRRVRQNMRKTLSIAS
jgi:hypothetical protein